MEAEKFLLKDASGRTRAELETSRDGPALRLYDKNGHKRAELTLTAPLETPSLQMYDDRGKARVTLFTAYGVAGLHLSQGSEKLGEGVSLSAVEGAAGFLALGRHNGLPGVTLGATQDGSQLRLYDTNGYERAELAATGNGPDLALADATGKLRTALVVPASESTLPALTDPYRNSLMEIGVTPNSPALYLYGATEKPSAYLGLFDGAPSLRLRDDAGFETAIGSGQMRAPQTGTTQKTSAASVVLSDNSGRVIWRAP